MRYLDRLKTLPTDDPGNALVLGLALHTGLEKGIEAALDEYYGAYPIISDQHINEAMKLEALLPKAKTMLPDGQYEVEITHPHFTGFIDLLAPVTMFRGEPAPNLYDLYDFKYTGNGSRYLDSNQLHLYKYFFEITNPGAKIRNLNYLIIPKTKIRQKKTETLQDFRKRLESELSKMELEILTVEYDPSKVIEFTLSMKELLEQTDFPKQPSYLCNWCDYKQYCESNGEIDYEIIYPRNKK